MLWVLIRVPWQGTSNGYPQQSFQGEIRKILSGHPSYLSCITLNNGQIYKKKKKINEGCLISDEGYLKSDDNW